MSQSMSPLRWTLSWLFTPLYVVVFISILCVFHLFQVVASAFGRRAQKWVLDRMNVCIVWNIRILTGASYRVVGKPSLPQGRPVILVSNHQSMYDIPMIMWECRSREVGFIAKKELGRGLPSISYALRTLGSVLIDRADPAGSVAAIRAFGQRKESQCQVAAIFPEGTRARDGAMKRFKATGFRTLISAMPSALVQPVAIRGNWELLRYNFAPLPFGTRIELEFLEPIEQAGRGPDELLELIQARIQAAVSGDAATKRVA